MLQPYPETDAARIDEAAELEHGVLKSYDACRTLRSEMKMGPSQRMPLLGQATSAPCSACALSDAARAAVRGHIVDELPQAEAPVSIIDNFRLMLKIESMSPPKRAPARKEPVWHGNWEGRASSPMRTSWNALPLRSSSRNVSAWTKTDVCR